MPKKKQKETPEEQQKRFEAEIARMIEAGELDPADADAAFERAMGCVVKRQAEWFSAGED